MNELGNKKIHLTQLLNTKGRQEVKRDGLKRTLLPLMNTNNNVIDLLPST
ncbi:hypothetical protein SDC9_157491 [bioreactor metagenome]|uniref:Uncharacterized protein n=1 Tax=bioreactor metagenome TaxID=1076179 RepID=A0A645F9A1_9ZZZZ